MRETEAKGERGEVKQSGAGFWGSLFGRFFFCFFSRLMCMLVGF